MRGVVAKTAWSARSSLSQVLAIACALALPACSIVMPFEDRGSAVLVDNTITGSIAPRPAREPAMAPGQVSPFSARLDAEDWRRQRAALSTALDPQGNGGQVRWDNPDSGAKGSFSAVGDAFLIRHDICRTFVAMVASAGTDEWFQGSACRTAPGEWLVNDMKPWRKPG